MSNQNLDIEKELLAENDPLKRIELLLSHASTIRYSLTNKSQELYQRAAELSIQNNYLNGAAKANYGLSTIFIYKSDYKAALESLDKAFESFKSTNDLEFISRALINYGQVFYLLNDYEKSFEKLFKAKELIEKNESLKFLSASCYNTLANLYFTLKDYDQALWYYQQSLEFSTNEKEKATPYSNISSVYKVLKQYDKAIENLNKSIEIKKRMNFLPGLAYSYSVLAEVYLLTAEYEKAKTILLETIDLAKSFDNTEIEFMGLIRLGNVAIKQNNKSAIKDCIERCELAINKIDVRELKKRYYEFISEAYFALEDYIQSWKFQKLYNALTDEINEIDLKNRLNNLKMVSEVELGKRENEIFRLRNVELKQAHDELLHQKNEMDASLRYALKIQRAILGVKKVKSTSIFGIHISFPRDIVSGDFIWKRQRKNQLYLALDDCTGHGVPAAMLTMLGISVLNHASGLEEISSPSQILSYLDQKIKMLLQSSDSEEKISDGMDICIIKLNLDSKVLEFAGANRPLLYLKNGVLNEQKPDKVSIGGIYSDLDISFTNHEIKLNPNDRIFLYSDGYTDQFGGPKNKKFGTTRLKEMLQQGVDMTFHEQAVFIERQFLDWKGNTPQTDDVTFVGVQVK